MTSTISRPMTLLAAALAATVMAAPALAQQAGGSADSHLVAAKAAAGNDHVALFDAICRPPPGPPQAAGGPRPVPERSTWHYDPVKVFDNLYYIGEKEFSAWAVVTSEGIIVIDTIWAHSVEDEIVNGLKTLGFDPANIKYAIVSHAHIDHIGGAKYLQDKYGKQLTLGDTTLTMYLTPGHTPGTISMLIPVKDRGQPHLVASWGGTAFNFELTPANFQVYINSAVRYHDIVAKSGADILLSNHTVFDGSHTKLPAVAVRKPGDPNPYVVGNDAVQRYVKVAEECARANLARLN